MMKKFSLVTKNHLDQFKHDMQNIVNQLLNHSLKINVKTKDDINSTFSNNGNAKGIYIWYTTCKPKIFIDTWKRRKDLYQEYKTINSNSSNKVSTDSGNPIDFLLPNINSNWERNPKYITNRNSIVPLYVGKAENETLKNRLCQHYNGSIQTSALKLFGSTLDEQRKNSIIKEFINKDFEILNNLSMKNIHCKVIIIEETQKDRLLTYERVLREVLEPLIGEK